MTLITQTEAYIRWEYVADRGVKGNRQLSEYLILQTMLIAQMAFEIEYLQKKAGME